MPPEPMSQPPPTSPEQVRRKWDALLNVINNVSADGGGPSPAAAVGGGAAAAGAQATSGAARDLLQQSASLKESRTKPMRASSRQDWDDRHHLLFSIVNGDLQKNVRDYFDRTRDTEGYGLRHRASLRTTWQLSTPHVEPTAEEMVSIRKANVKEKEHLKIMVGGRQDDPPLQHTPTSKAGSKITGMTKSASAPDMHATAPEMSKRWDRRHQVMFDKDNHHYHPNFREYFERPRKLLF